MTAFDTKMRAVAVKLINKFGLDITWTSESYVYDPLTQEGIRTPTAVTVKASPPMKFSEKMVDGDVVQKDDFIIFLAATTVEDLSFTPIIGGLVEFNSKKFEVLNVNPVWSGEQVAAYEVHCRGN